MAQKIDFKDPKMTDRRKANAIENYLNTLKKEEIRNVAE